MRAPGSRRDSLIVFAAAVALRLLYFATANGPSFSDPLIDADAADALGVRLATGQGFEPGPFWQPPLYPLVLGGLYALLGHSLLWPRLLQAALDGVTAVVTTQLAARATGSRRLGLGAGLAVALHGSLLFYSGELLPTTLATCLGAVALWLALGAGASTKRAIGSGLFVGLAGLAVATQLALVVPLALLTARSRRLNGLLLALACVGVVGVATVANVARSGEWVLVSANGGINFYLGNGQRADELVAIRPGKAWQALLDEPARAGIVSPSGQDRYFVRKGLSECGAQPLACAGRFIDKVRLLFRSREIPRNESVDVVRSQSPVLRVLLARVGWAALPWGLLLPLAVAGAVRAFRQPSEVSRLALWSSVALAAMPVLFFVTGRYRAPLTPAVTVLAAMGLGALWAERRRAWREAAAACCALGLAVWPAPRPVDEVNYEAELYWAVGGRRARLGDDDGAMEAWRQALESRPDYLEARFDLALALVRAERWDEAAAELREVLELYPGNAIARELLDAATETP